MEEIQNLIKKAVEDAINKSIDDNINKPIYEFVATHDAGTFVKYIGGK